MKYKTLNSVHAKRLFVMLAFLKLTLFRLYYELQEYIYGCVCVCVIHTHTHFKIYQNKSIYYNSSQNILENIVVEEEQNGFLTRQ